MFLPQFSIRIILLLRRTIAGTDFCPISRLCLSHLNLLSCVQYVNVRLINYSILPSEALRGEEDSNTLFTHAFNYDYLRRRILIALGVETLLHYVD